MPGDICDLCGRLGNLPEHPPIGSIVICNECLKGMDDVARFAEVLNAQEAELRELDLARYRETLARVEPLLAQANSRDVSDDPTQRELWRAICEALGIQVGENIWRRDIDNARARIAYMRQQLESEEGGD